MNERYFVICEDEDGSLIFATHGYFSTRASAESYARSLTRRRNPRVVTASDEFYKRDSIGACGS